MIAYGKIDFPIKMEGFNLAEVKKSGSWTTKCVLQSINESFQSQNLAGELDSKCEFCSCKITFTLYTNEKSTKDVFEWIVFKSEIT